MHDTGVILKVTPRVNANGVVSLDVSQEVSAVQPTADATLTPTISERKVQSTIAVASGQTVMLAGMISSTQQNTRNGLPILGDLKGIGDLFATNDKQTNRTELIVFIRPQIIRNGLDAQLVAEELRSKLSVVAREAARSRPARELASISCSGASLMPHRWAVAAALAGAALSFALLPFPAAGFAAVLAALAVYVAAVDLDRFIIPDVANVAIFAAGLALVAVEGWPRRSARRSRKTRCCARSPPAASCGACASSMRARPASKDWAWAT